jgi:hypothetical protein
MPSIFYLNLLKLVILTFDLHQRSPHGKADALPYKGHFSVDFFKISELESKILAFLVSGMPKPLHPYRIHLLSNFKLNFLLAKVINIGNNSTKFHKNV